MQRERLSDPAAASYSTGLWPAELLVVGDGAGEPHKVSFADLAEDDRDLVAGLASERRAAAHRGPMVGKQELDFPRPRAEPWAAYEQRTAQTEVDRHGLDGECARATADYVPRTNGCLETRARSGAALLLVDPVQDDELEGRSTVDGARPAAQRDRRSAPLEHHEPERTRSQAFSRLRRDLMDRSERRDRRGDVADRAVDAPSIGVELDLDCDRLVLYESPHVLPARRALAAGRGLATRWIEAITRWFEA